MRHPYRTIALTIVAVVFTTGCSVSYPFQLLLTVKNADDGTPLEGVTGTLDTMGVEEQKTRLDYGFGLQTHTGTDGRLTYDFNISGSPDRFPHWYLKLHKDGFEPVVIDIQPNPVPDDRKNRQPIPVTVEMKPTVKKAEGR